MGRRFAWRKPTPCPAANAQLEDPFFDQIIEAWFLRFSIGKSFSACSLKKLCFEPLPRITK
jgi:hypothetical protein